MFIFFLSAVVLVVLALIFVLPAMLGTRSKSTTDQNDQNVTISRERLAVLKTDLENNVISVDEFDKLKLELEQTLASDLNSDAESPVSQQNPLWAIVTALSVPIVTTGFYLAVGTPATITGQLPAQVAQTPHATQDTPSAQAPQSATPEQQVASVEAMVTNLAQRLEQNPNDAEGWMMLARSYTVIGRHDDAIAAYEILHTLVGDQPEVLAQYAGALIVANRGEANPQAQDFLTRALAANPNEARALWLSGILAQQQGDPIEALRLWRHLEGILEPGSEPLNNLRQMIAQVEQETGITSETPQADQANLKTVDASMSVSVTLDDSLIENASPDDIVFIFARATQGPPMPLAVVRKQVKDLPVQVTLDDSMAMMPEMRLSQFEQVNVGARVSMTGNALPQPGDLQGLTGPVSVTNKETTDVTIDEIVQ